MKSGSRREIILLFAANVLARLPFINAGYGREEDAWAQAQNAKQIWETGIYEVSRLPGHPLYELLLAGLWPINHSYWLFNLLSVLVSSLSVVYFYKICNKLNLLNTLALSVAFSFIPVFFIAGTYTIDYNFGLLFILISLYQLLRGKYWLAGIFIGLATGIRISHLGFILPWAIIIFTRTHSLKFVLRMGLTSLLVAAIAFSPPLLQYGMGFLDFHKPPYPSTIKVLYKMSVGVYGIPLLLFFAYFFFTNIRKPFSFWTLHSYYSRMPRGFYISLLLIFAMQLVVFLRLPFKSEFFIPFLPFLLMYLGVLMNRKQAISLAIVSIASCFFFGFDYYNPYRGAPPSPLGLRFEGNDKSLFFDPIQGPAIIDIRKRNTKIQFVEEFNAWAKKQSAPTYVIAGWYWPQIDLKQQYPSNVEVDYYATEEEVRNAHKNGKSIFYLPEINEANAQINSHYLADSLGKPWLPETNKE
ncbi:hypothetical protein [Owenweeksia hongkongensis]|uniref:hypothetical protein n=1 Tax=Owenweeksia hongkongensis TaxID=253245 RepID=UPI003A93050D